ncbi:hypothetical protein A3K63_04485 [Candidatus Micrarchaeota archaeon RBG_16_49_10]|nr:MAG: hypothetical protein A3K63_04485 [Candidatus Micrarchaeota archaeon RBG_16_49_10]
MQQESILIELFGKTPELKVLDFLIDNNIFDFTKTEIAEGAGITRPTLYRFWDKMEKNKLIAKSRKINRTQLYRLNLESATVKKVMEIELKVGLSEIENEKLVRVPVKLRR